MKEEAKTAVESGNAFLGIELGSTRIKAVLIDENHTPLASGAHDWENRLEDGVWTYSLEDIWSGLQDCYRSLAEDVKKRYGAELRRVGAIGVSAMMHGYMAFDREGELLTPFRTWRNTFTEPESVRLSELFQFNIPSRWTAAHYCHALLSREEHVDKVAFLTTLAGYVHWKLTGEKVLGIGDASGMFPIDPETLDYHRGMVDSFGKLTGVPADRLAETFPKVLTAGDRAGELTEAGARLLDPTGRLEPGIPFCPPEGDAGTGMVATNSVAPGTGNVSAGTSIFAMVVLDKKTIEPHKEIDMVTTPDGRPVAMAHCNNCTSDLNGWVGLLAEFAEAMGCKADKGELYALLFRKALEGEPDCGGMLSYNYFSGEPITDSAEGRPMFARVPDSKMTLANFMRSHLYSALATLKIGLDILLRQEKVKVDRIMGHGGFFKTPEVGQKMMAAAINAPVTVMENAGEGGSWGIAILAAYMIRRRPGEALSDYLDQAVFAGSKGQTIEPDKDDVAGFESYVKLFKECLPCERLLCRKMYCRGETEETEGEIEGETEEKTEEETEEETEVSPCWNC